MEIETNNPPLQSRSGSQRDLREEAWRLPTIWGMFNTQIFSQIAGLGNLIFEARRSFGSVVTILHRVASVGGLGMSPAASSVYVGSATALPGERLISLELLATDRAAHSA
jgi:hypothetical protein